MIQVAALDHKNKRKSIRISIIAHIALILLAFWYLLPPNPAEDLKPEYIVTVDFTDFKESSLSKYAHADPGKKRPKTVEVKKVKTAPVKPVEVKTPPREVPKTTPEIVTKPVEPEVSEILEEESIIEAIEEDIEIEEPDLEEIPEPEPEPEPIIEEVEEVEEPVEEVLEIEAPSQVDLPADTGSDAATSSDEGSSDTAPSIFDGEEGGTGKGSEGDGAGMDGDSGNDGDSGSGDGGAGTGKYDGSGDGIFGRKVIFRDVKALMAAINESGTISIKTCVNRDGNVTYVEIIEDETTTRNKKVLRKALAAIRNYKFEPESTAAQEECGKMVISQDLSDVNKFN